MEWKDTTSYSQSDKERIPRSWTIKSVELSITVHRHRDYDKDVWLLSCVNLHIDCKQLGNKDIELAKNEALNYVASYINILSSEINLMIEETNNETRN